MILKNRKIQINFIYCINLQNMQNTLLQTPQKSKKQRLKTPVTQSFSVQVSPYAQKTSQHTYGINFQRKAFEMMDTIIELRKKQKKYSIYIFNMEQQIKKLTFEIQRLMLQKEQNHKKLLNTRIKENNPEKQDKQTSKLLREIQFTKEMMHKYKHFGIQSINHSAQIFSKNKGLEQQNKTLKKQLTVLLIQDTKLRNQIEELQTKKQGQNQDVLVSVYEDAKLISEYKGQIAQKNAYIQKLQAKLSKKESRKSIQDQQNSCDSEFSFAESPKKNKEMKIEQLQMEIECLKASIGGLLQENKNIKKLFKALHRSKAGEKLSAQLERQIEIINSILLLNKEEFV